LQLTIFMQNDALLEKRLMALRKREISPSELYGLIHDLGHSTLLEAEPDVVALLDHPDSSIREIAVRVLTFHWDISKHRDKLIHLLRHDPDYEVKSFTAAGLGFVFRNSHDPVVSQALIKTVRDRDEDPYMRESAYNALLQVWSPLDVDQDLKDISEEIRRSKASDIDLESAQSPEEFQSRLRMWKQEKLLKIDWEFVERVEREIGAGPSPPSTR
jgi:hypothetical protein